MRDSFHHVGISPQLTKKSNRADLMRNSEFLGENCEPQLLDHETEFLKSDWLRAIRVLRKPLSEATFNRRYLPHTGKIASTFA